ncbi:hypothetical protein BSKO_01445 [Bryopsis sp. KO-2023]|nr:hypothetical protein BSKO_01445 [Bryopsis sp. KO-2023]
MPTPSLATETIVSGVGMRRALSRTLKLVDAFTAIPTPVAPSACRHAIQNSNQVAESFLGLRCFSTSFAPRPVYQAFAHKRDVTCKRWSSSEAGSTETALTLAGDTTPKQRQLHKKKSDAKPKKQRNKFKARWNHWRVVTKQNKENKGKALRSRADKRKALEEKWQKSAAYAKEWKANMVVD